MIYKIQLSLLFLALTFGNMLAQQNPFIGSFINASQTISVQFKAVGNEMHGLFQSQGAAFAIKGQVQGNKISGKIFGLDGPVAFTGTYSSNGYVFNSPGYSEAYLKFSDQHSLASYDLTPYMIDFRQNQSNGQDFNYSYSQTDNGQVQEEYNSYPSGGNFNCPYPEYKDTELFNMIAGSQVVYYTRTSYVNDNTASSITYVNFCQSGTFSRNIDGSFMVEGSYGGNSQGASYSRNSGQWKLVTYQGQPAVYMMFNNGETSINPVNKALIRQGRWRSGNTQFAVQRNKVRC